MRLLRVLLVVAVLVAGLTITPRAIAVVFTVNTTTDPAPDGVCDASDCSLREAVVLANANGATIDQINLIAGQTHTLTAASGSDILIDSEILLMGNGATIEPSGAYTDNLITVSPAGDLDLRNVTLEDGSVTDDPESSLANGGAVINQGTFTAHLVTFHSNEASDFGGAISTDSGSSTVLLQATFSENQATHGGSIFNGGALTIVESTFTLNSATEFGGAIMTNSSSEVSISRSVFDENDAGTGGAVVSVGKVAIDSVEFTGNDALGPAPAFGAGGALRHEGGGTLTVLRSTFDDNTALVGGGALSTVDSVDLVESLLTDNHAGGDPLALAGGGAIQADGETLVENSTISGNTTEDFGGGIRASGEVTISNSTITANIANFEGSDGVGDTGGVHANGPPISIEGSIIFGNSVDGGGGSSNCHGTISNGGNVITAGCGVGSGDTTADPGLLPLADNGGPTQTHGFGLTSSARDVHNGPSCTGTDQRSVPRPQGPSCDAGAYELTVCRGAIATIVGTDGADSPVGTDGNDVIHVFGDDDVVNGGAGKDKICGGDGADELLGEGGADQLDGGSQLAGTKDVCKGGGGKDKFKGCEVARQ